MRRVLTLVVQAGSMVHSTRIGVAHYRIDSYFMVASGAPRKGRYRLRIALATERQANAHVNEHGFRVEKKNGRSFHSCYLRGLRSFHGKPVLVTFKKIKPRSLPLSRRGGRR